LVDRHGNQITTRRVIITERKNTLVCTFTADGSKPSAYDIHEWIFDELRIPEQVLLTIQIDNIKRNVFLKMINENNVQEIIAKKGGTAQYKSPGGSITQVTLEHAGIGHKK
jgi:hypothetical protein